MKHISTLQVLLAAGWLTVLSAAAQQPATITDTTTNLPASKPFGFSTNFEFSTPLTNELAAPPIEPFPFGIQTNQSYGVGPTTTQSGELSSPVFGTGVLGGAAGFGSQTQVPAGPGMFRVGPLDFHPMLNYSFMDATGIQNRPGSSGGTIVNTVSPGLWIKAGDHWVLNYTESTQIYSGNTDLSDSTSENVFLHGGFTNHDWGFSLTQGYSSSSSVLADTGAQTEQEIFLTTLSTSHPIGSKASVELSVSQTLRSTDQFDRLKMWSGYGGFNYSLSPHVLAGVSISGGYDSIHPGSDMEDEQFQGTLRYFDGERIILDLAGGAQAQQFVSGGAPSTVTPIYSASLQYQLFKPTVLFATAARTLTPSYFGGLDTTATRVTAGVRQRLTKKLELTVLGGYNKSDFAAIEPVSASSLTNFGFGFPVATTTIAPQAVVRNDTSEFINTTLNYAFHEHITASAFFLYGRNSSSQSAFAYTTTQAGFQLRYQY